MPPQQRNEEMMEPPLEEVSLLGAGAVEGEGTDDPSPSSFPSSSSSMVSLLPNSVASMMESDRRQRRYGRPRRRSTSSSCDDGNRPTTAMRRNDRGSSFQAMLNRSSQIEVVRRLPTTTTTDTKKIATDHQKIAKIATSPPPSDGLDREELIAALKMRRSSKKKPLVRSGSAPSSFNSGCPTAASTPMTSIATLSDGGDCGDLLDPEEERSRLEAGGGDYTVPLAAAEEERRDGGSDCEYADYDEALSDYGDDEDEDGDDAPPPSRFACRERRRRVGLFRRPTLGIAAGSFGDGAVPIVRAGVLTCRCRGKVRKRSKSPAPLPSSAALPGDKPRSPNRSAAHSDPLVLFGKDISSLSPSLQFGLCASGVFGFTIVYGYLQELLAVHIAGRKYALFLASVQFAGYAFWSAVLRGLDRRREGGGKGDAAASRGRAVAECFPKKLKLCRSRGGDATGLSAAAEAAAAAAQAVTCENHCNNPSTVPLRMYVGLSLVRSLDLGMTNGAMRYLNYPAKTLIKSSRVAFTMMLGLVIGGNRKYRPRDYACVAMLVIGLGVFLHADATSDAVFHPLGVAMLVVSLICDGVVANWSEVIMREHSVSQDEFQARLYSIAFLATTIAAHLNGELFPGIRDFLLRGGTVEELELLSSSSTDEEATTLIPSPTSHWTPLRKATVLILFASTGLFGSSCAGAITKRFGALSMSVTSTARKATTLFLSFAAFQSNRCTPEHVAGVAMFLAALTGKAACAKGRADSAASAAADAERAKETADDAVAAVGSPKARDSELDLARGDDSENVREELSCDATDLEEGLTDVPMRDNDDCGVEDDEEENHPLLGGSGAAEHQQVQNGGETLSLFEAARSSSRVGSLLHRIVGVTGGRRRKKWSNLESMSSGATHMS